MGVGGSGRIVIEIDPDTKRNLYAVLYREGHTLKDWFLDRAEDYIRTSGELSMFNTRPEREESDERS